MVTKLKKDSFLSRRIFGVTLQTKTESISKRRIGDTGRNKKNVKNSRTKVILLDNLQTQEYLQTVFLNQ